MQKWETIGTVGVDAGLIMIGDPCYVAHDSHPDHPVHHWSDFCNLIEKGDHWNIGDGVVVTSGYGDGEYPVQIRRAKDGRIAEVRVRFI